MWVTGEPDDPFARPRTTVDDTAAKAAAEGYRATGDLLRDYVLKGVTLSNHSPAHLLAVEHELIHRCLASSTGAGRLDEVSGDAAVGGVENGSCCRTWRPTQKGLGFV